eukprot:5269998-Amphidinium_carterae.1
MIASRDVYKTTGSWLPQRSTELSNFESWTNLTGNGNTVVDVGVDDVVVSASNKKHRISERALCVKCPHQKRRGTASNSQAKPAQRHCYIPRHLVATPRPRKGVPGPNELRHARARSRTRTHAHTPIRSRV